MVLIVRMNILEYIPLNYFKTDSDSEYFKLCYSFGCRQHSQIFAPKLLSTSAEHKRAYSFHLQPCIANSHRIYLLSSPLGLFCTEHKLHLAYEWARLYSPNALCSLHFYKLTQRLYTLLYCNYFIFVLLTSLTCLDFE